MLTVNVAYCGNGEEGPLFWTRNDKKRPLVRCRKDGKWSGLSYRRLRDRSRSQELDFDQIEILAQQTGCAKVTLPKPGQLGASAAKQDDQPARSEAIRRLVELGLKVKGEVQGAAIHAS
jgi:hypothetical protein